MAGPQLRGLFPTAPPREASFVLGWIVSLWEVCRWLLSSQQEDNEALGLSDLVKGGGG